MTADVPTTDRCPACGAAVRIGDPWCTLCYADLRPPAPVEPEPVPEPVADPPAYSPSTAVRGPDPLTAPLEAVTSPVLGPSWPCSGCGTVNPMARDVCSACGRHFLAGVREDEAPILELPVVGDITQLTRGHRFAIAGGVVLAFILLTVVLGLIFG
jgi:hypothetical protein